MEEIYLNIGAIITWLAISIGCIMTFWFLFAGSWWIINKINPNMVKAIVLYWRHRRYFEAWKRDIYKLYGNKKLSSWSLECMTPRELFDCVIDKHGDKESRSKELRDKNYRNLLK